MIQLSISALLREYRDGHSMSVIARKYGVSTNTIRNRLVGAGEPLRKQGCPSNRKPIPLDLEEIKRLRELGFTHKKIAQRYGVCEKTIRNRLSLST